MFYISVYSPRLNLYKMTVMCVMFVSVCGLSQTPRTSGHDVGSPAKHVPQRSQHRGHGHETLGKVSPSELLVDLSSSI